MYWKGFPRFFFPFCEAEVTSQGPLLFLNDLGSTYGTATQLQIDSYL